MRAVVLATGLALMATAAQAADPTPEQKAADERLAACAPATVKAALVCLDTEWQAPFRDAFLATPYEDLIRYHFGLGMWIRNNWIRHGRGLGGDMSKDGPRHIDDMSQALIETYWLAKHGCSGPNVPQGIVQPMKNASGCPTQPKESAL